MIMDIDKWKECSPIVLRYGLVAVFLFFSISQLTAPDEWVSYLPGFLQSNPNATMFIIGNGIFELVFAILLGLGLFTRVSSLLLGLHLLGITVTVGFNEIGARDFGLTMALFAIFLNGQDKWCLDNRVWKNK
jgi:uncharacterized membrane protein YphA (DoxX/SURF4 family)